MLYVRIIETSTLVLPTAFTPQGDGRNDRFRARTKDIPAGGFELKVQRLNGDVVFVTTDINGSWDGKQGDSLAGDYLYESHVRYTDQSGGSHELCSYLYLLRDVNGCIMVKQPDVPKYLFEEQINPLTMRYEYYSGERFCF